MKRAVALILTAVMLIAVAGCSGRAKEGSAKPSASADATTPSASSTPSTPATTMGSHGSVPADSTGEPDPTVVVPVTTLPSGYPAAIAPVIDGGQILNVQTITENERYSVGTLTDKPMADIKQYAAKALTGAANYKETPSDKAFAYQGVKDGWLVQFFLIPDAAEAGKTYVQIVVAKQK